MQIDNSPYFGKRDMYYYISVSSIQIDRDNKISDLFGENIDALYIGQSNFNSSDTSVTDDLRYVRFWKDKNGVNYFQNRTQMYRIYTKLKICEMPSHDFINLIPDKYEIENFISKRNLRLKKEQIKSDRKWLELRSKYKAINSYRKVTDPHLWMPCPNCGLIPIIWEYNNGKSTACGCGKDEYNHCSIHSESIMSYVSRNNGSAMGYDSNELRFNWNQWVKTGQNIFEEIKKNKNIW